MRQANVDSWIYLAAEHSIQQGPKRLAGHCSILLQYAPDVDYDDLLLTFGMTVAAIRLDLIELQHRKASRER